MIRSLFGLSALCLLAIATAFLCRTPIGWINLRPALISRLARLSAKRFDPKNRAEAGENYVLSRSAMEEAIQLYTPDKSARHQAWVSPLYAPSLAGLPATLITTAHLDPLRDQGEAYAQRLRAQGVQVRLKRFPATIHDFIGSAKALRASSAMAVEMLRGVNTRERNASGDA